MTNYLEMSDEEFESVSPEEAVIEQTGDEQASDENTDNNIEDTKTPDVKDDENLDTGDNKDLSSDAGDDNAQDEDESDLKDKDDDPEIENDEDKDPDNTDGEKEEEKQDSGESSKTSAFEEEILAPFKANGREMQVSSAEEARTLMMQGANYNKKMLEIKPALSIVQALEKNELLNNDTINFMIDVQKGKPEAIAKLLKDTEFNLLKYDEEKEVDYTAEQHLTEVNEQTDKDAIQNAVDQISSSKHFDEVIDVLQNFDEDTVSEFESNPNLIVELEKNIANGEFKTIDRIINTQKALGKLKGMSYLEAYNMYAEEVAKGENFIEEQKQKTLASVADKKKQIRQKKKNISSKNERKAAPKKDTQPKEVDFLSMSDEDFEKFDAKFN